MTFLFTSEVEKAVDGCENTVRCILKNYQEGGWDFSDVIVVNVCTVSFLSRYAQIRLCEIFEMYLIDLGLISFSSARA